MWQQFLITIKSYNMSNETIDITQNTKPPMTGLVVKWGLIISLALIASSIIIYMAGLSTNKAVGWINYVLMLVGAIFATKIYRDEKCNGYISFGRAFQFGYLTLLLVGIITAIYTYIFFQFIAPEMIGQILTEVENQMMSSGQSDEQVERAMGYTRKFMTPQWMGIWVIGGTIFLGAILSLISSAVVKKENLELQSPM